MGNINCPCTDNDEMEDINIRTMTRKRFFILTKQDFLEIDRIYEKHELHKVVIVD